MIVGAGPAGLAAAVYGPSKGLDVLMMRRIRRAGRQDRARGSRTSSVFLPASPARSSPGSPSLRRKVGAKMLVAGGAAQLTWMKPVRIRVNKARSRRVGRHCHRRSKFQASLRNLTTFEGAGVYYNATFIEAQL